MAELGDDWKQIADRLGLKNKREAILEFLRIPISDSDRSDHQFLVDLAYKPLSDNIRDQDLREINPYNQAD